MRRRSVVRYRRFGITYRSHIQGSRSPRRMTETLRYTVALGMVWTVTVSLPMGNTYGTESKNVKPFRS
jgi:hypothetical protein